MPTEESVREPRQPRVIKYGPLASMLDHLPAGAAPHAREALLRACTNTGIRVDDVIVGARSVVATHDAGLGTVIRDIMHDVLRHSRSDYKSESPPVVEIAVRYDGIDLHDVARRCDTTTDAVIELHTKTEFVVEFCGFSPGFAYLAGLPSALDFHVEPHHERECRQVRWRLLPSTPRCIRANLPEAGIFSAPPTTSSGMNIAVLLRRCNQAHVFDSWLHRDADRRAGWFYHGARSRSGGVGAPWSITVRRRRPNIAPTCQSSARKHVGCRHVGNHRWIGAVGRSRDGCGAHGSRMQRQSR